MRQAAGVRARRIWRATRDVPVLGHVARLVDRFWWARVIARSELVDTEFYAAQLGRDSVAGRIAIAHYVLIGFRRGLSLNPLFDEVFAGGGLPEVFRVPALYAYLLSDRRAVAVHPLWAEPSPADSDSTATDVLPQLERVWRERETALIELRAGVAGATVSVADFRLRAVAAARNWARGPKDLRINMPEDNQAGFSIIRMVQAGDRRYARRLAQLSRLAPQAQVVAVLVDPDASQWVSAAALAMLHPTLTVIARPSGTTWGEAVSAAWDACRGDVVVGLDPRVELTDDELHRLAGHAERGAAAIPASRSLDGTLAGLGSARTRGATPYAILREHPQEDLDRMGEEVISVPLLTGRTFALAKRSVERAGGWPSGLVNDGELELLSGRLRRIEPDVELVVDAAIRPVQDEPERAFSGRRPRRLARALAASDIAYDERAVKSIARRAGFAVEGWHGDGSPVLSWRRPHPGAQRWAIRTSAPAGRQAAVWGDYHFATGLARALRRRGHFVVIDTYGGRDRSSAGHDDVSIVVRGPNRLAPRPTGVNIEWIISHPDQITGREVAEFDVVFAASELWARKATARWGHAVRPLLECVDTDQFFPRGLPRTDEIVFVGTARGIPRPSVVAPLRAGIPVLVYGPDWRPFIPSVAIAATSIPNADLAERYETASIVLNDQWPAMRKEGFIAMRPFDAVAVGGRVVSESVHGIDEIFGGAVVTYRTEGELLALLRRDPAELFPSDDQLFVIAERIRTQHSFDARAAELDEAARSVLSARGSAPSSRG